MRTVGGRGERPLCASFHSVGRIAARIPFDSKRKRCFKKIKKKKTRTRHLFVFESVGFWRAVWSGSEASKETRNEPADRFRAPVRNKQKNGQLRDTKNGPCLLFLHHLLLLGWAGGGGEGVEGLRTEFCSRSCLACLPSFGRRRRFFRWHSSEAKERKRRKKNNPTEKFGFLHTHTHLMFCFSPNSMGGSFRCPSHFYFTWYSVVFGTNQFKYHSSSIVFIFKTSLIVKLTPTD